MLCKIDPAFIKDARRILTLLCFASRPLTLPELVDGIAVEITEPTGLNKDRRLDNYIDIHDICPGFVSLNVAGETFIVQIAHFSVQEYLESDRIRQQKAMIFGLNSVRAHAEIAQICLIYLLDSELSSSVLNRNVLKEYPLAKFAAEYWYDHYIRTANTASELNGLTLRLFQQEESFKKWVDLHNMDERGPGGRGKPLYYASLLGLKQVLHGLLNTKQQEGILIVSPLYASVINVYRNQCSRWISW